MLNERFISMSKNSKSFMLTLVSHNTKTGPMPVSTSPMFTCSPACPFRDNGCYASYGRIKMWWQRCQSINGNIYDEYNEFLDNIRNLILPNKHWRHNQAGDLLPTENFKNRIDTKASIALVNANKGKRGYTYTHFPVIKQFNVENVDFVINKDIINFMNSNGFVVNISANSICHADTIKASGIKAPIVTVLPESYKKDNIIRETTPGGNTLIVCPNVTKGIQCIDCGLCMKSKRKSIIGFPAHGSGKRHAENIFKDWGGKNSKSIYFKQHD
jgi:hypothetical protein